jgi:replicative DNA helicase
VEKICGMIQNIEIERFLLAHLISYPGKQRVICKSLSENDFTIDAHKELFNTIQKASVQQVLADTTYLISKGYKEQAIFDITASIPLTIHDNNYQYWITELRELAMKRKISENCNEAIQSLRDKNPDDILNELSLSTIDTRKLSLNVEADSNTSIIESVRESIDRAKAGDGIMGLKFTGIHEVDKKLNGGEAGNYIIFAGRPGMGKSVLAVNMIKEAIRGGFKLVLWTLEMSAVDYVQRVVCALSDVNYGDLRNGRVNKDDLRQAEIAFINSKVKIIDKAGVNIEQIYNTLLTEHEKEPIDIVCIDHLGLIAGKGNLYERTTHNSNFCKVMAKELSIPLVVLSQLNRAVESRGGNKHPQLSDLRESGAIEQDADKVVFIHRPSYYDIPEDDCFIIAKNRGGVSGLIEVKFDFNRMLFKGLQDDYFESVADDPIHSLKRTANVPF